MQGILHRTDANPLLQLNSKLTNSSPSRTVLGPSSVNPINGESLSPPSHVLNPQSHILHPKRIDNPASTQVDPATSNPSHTTTTFQSVNNDITVEDMPVEIPAPHRDLSPSAPVPMRINTEGPWSVSVAENPYDASSYSVYVKTPTHHLTLTRTVKEICDLHAKLQDAYPNTALPPLPEMARTPNTKRRSSFLHTLSRLTSPKEKASNKSSPSSRLQTPVVSPTSENNDPFSMDGPDVDVSVGALPEYLTTLSNHPTFRGSRPWKRFVRVRTDDLESVRVERAIKRVRSDLARGSSSRQDLVVDIPPLPLHESSLGLGLDMADAIAKAGQDTPPPSANTQKTIHEVIEEDETRTVDSGVVDGNGTVDVPVEPIVSNDIVEIIDLPDLPSSSSSSVTSRGHVRATSSLQASSSQVSSTLGASASGSRVTSTEPTSPEDTGSSSPISPVNSTRNGTEKDVAVSPTSPTSPSPSTSTSQSRPKTFSRTVRSASVDADSAHVHRLSGRSWKPSPLNPAHAAEHEHTVDLGMDTEAEAGFDTDIEHPSVITPLRRKKRQPKKIGVDDFEMMRVLGKGCAGKVLLVRHRASSSLYALKAITKRHVLAHQELQHTLTEQAVLKRMSRESQDPFVVKLWWSFHDKENLFLVMDFHPGGDLATQLARWGRLGRDRARFYAAEIVEGVDGLHAAGVIYRDLKPENILIGADGHIVLTDFGLSKEFPRPRGALDRATAPSTPKGHEPGSPLVPRWMSKDADSNPPRDFTGTFCGTAEYLAPEVIQGLQYSYEVDWWSFGTMLYEMLSGITPFWANNHSDMYVRVLQDELQFPEDKAMDQDTKSLIRGLLQRNPALRMREPRIKKHPYFSMIDWSHVYYKRYIPPYIPPIDPLNASDTQNFDDAFLDMAPTVEDDPDPTTDSEREKTEDEKTDGETSSVQTPAGSVTSSTGQDGSTPVAKPEVEEESIDVFDGYSFKGRQSIIIDDEDEDMDDVEEEDEHDADAEDTIDLAKVDNKLDLDSTVVTADNASDVSIKAPVHHVEIEEPKTPTEAPREPTPEPPLPRTPVDLSLVTPLPPSPEEINVPLEPEEIATPLVEKVELIVPSPPESDSEIPDAALSTPIPASPSPPVRAEIESPPEVIDLITPIPRQAVLPKPSARQRREKAGISLDKFLSSPVEKVDGGKVPDQDEDDWDFVETPGGEEINGKTKTNSLFARGVVDRYRLAVFRKTSASQRPSRPPSSHRVHLDDHRTPMVDSAASSPSEKKRGRTPGLSIRKSTNKFLRPKSPPTTFVSPVVTPTRNSRSTPSHTGVSSQSTLMTPSPATSRLSMPYAIPPAPSLKSKSSGLSRISVGSPGSSDNSLNGDLPQSLSQSATEIATLKSAPDSSRSRIQNKPLEESEKSKNFKKMKTGAEKVLSLFGSPRQPS